MKKGIIAVCIIFILLLAWFGASKVFSEDAEEDILVYNAGGNKEITVDLAVQGPEHILYIHKIKLLADHPTVEDVIQAVKSDPDGIEIAVSDGGEIMEIEDLHNNTDNRWQIFIDNKDTSQRDVRNIPVEHNQGITFLYD